MGLLDGKVAIVTGAGHGIGRGHAMELARHGAKVVVNDLGGTVGGEGSSKDADLTVKIIESRGGTAVANHEDVADHEGAGRLIAQAVDEQAAQSASTPGQTPARQKTIEQIAAEHRARWPQPFKAGPLAVDIIRAERDAR